MTRTKCRSCGDTTPCQEFTLHVRDIVIHDEGAPDQDAESMSGQCDDCLEAFGPDDDCTEPEDDPRTDAEIRAERDCRDFDKGEL